ncbi:MAG: cyclic nucleotide-binding domain-containing protein [Chloroflexota bacterium]|nr:cyclic nucleotide-binding domain-containing protein [Chloroflexota bacterium]
MPDSTSAACVCGHSPGAHDGRRTGCAFCHCAEYRDPRRVITPPKNLSEKAVQALGLLAKAPAFHGVPEAALIAMADKGEKHLFLAGDVLISQGDAADALYLLVKGTVRIEQKQAGRTSVLGEMGPGEVVGEMGILDGSPRRASVIAADDIEVLTLSANLVKDTFREIPATLMAAVRLMNERLGRHRGG